MMRSSPLRLKELFFPQVSVKALVPVAPEKSDRELDLDNLAISFGLDFAKDGKTASAGLKIASKDPLADSANRGGLYQIQIDAFANFDVISPEHQDAMAVYLRKFAAAAALIGAAREQVALMTARGPWGVVMLPIISMDRVVGPPPKKAEPNPETIAAMEEARAMAKPRLGSAKKAAVAVDQKVNQSKARAKINKM